MAAYFSKNEASYSSFWNELAGGHFLYDEAFVAKTTNTFRKASGEHYSAMVGVEFSASLLHNHHIRVFEVHDVTEQTRRS
jgi:hypothetical protein